jgi:hypothetical protein
MLPDPTAWLNIEIEQERRDILNIALPGRTPSALILASVLSLNMLASGCGGDDESTGTAPADEGSEAGDAERGGTFTIGDRTWTVVPAVQCSVFAGDIVMIAGHTAENEEIEVVIDHDPSTEFFSAYIQGPDNSPYWIAEGDAITFTIDGKTVSGSGTFSVGLGGQIPEGEPRELPGSFEIRC